MGRNLGGLWGAGVNAMQVSPDGLLRLSIDELLSLPIHPLLGEPSVERICTHIQESLR